MVKQRVLKIYNRIADSVFFSREPLWPFVTSRVLLFLAAWIGLVWFKRPADPGEWQVFPNALWLDGWTRFDGGWYWDIIRLGYFYEPGKQTTVNFFPLYAWLVEIGSWPIRFLFSAPHAESFFLAGILLSNTFFYFALSGMFRLGTELIGKEAASKSLWSMALFPFSLFYSAVYTESLYLFLAVWGFYYARNEWWGRATLLGGLAAITRVPGWIVGIGIGLEYLRQRRYRLQAIDHHATTLMWMPLGLCSLLVYFWRRFGDPLVFIHNLGAFERKFGGDRLGEEAVIMLTSPDLSHRLLNAMYFLGILTLPFLAMIAWKRLGSSYGAFTFLSWGLAWITGLASVGRYLAVLFPAHYAMSLLLERRKSSMIWLCALYVPFLLWFTYLFTNWHLVN